MYATARLPVARRAATRKPQGRYSDAVPDAAALYPSSGYLDDLAWGAAWLAAATGQAAYLADAAAWAAAAAAAPSQALQQPQARGCSGAPGSGCAVGTACRRGGRRDRGAACIGLPGRGSLCSPAPGLRACMAHARAPQAPAPPQGLARAPHQ